MAGQRAISLHQAIALARLRNDKLGFLGFPNAVRTSDPDGELWILLNVGSEPPNSAKASANVVKAISELENIGIIDRRGDLNEGRRAALADGYAAQLDLLSQALVRHYDSFGLIVGYPAMEKICIGVIGEGLLPDELIDNLSSLSINSNRCDLDQLPEDIDAIVVANDALNHDLAVKGNVAARARKVPFLYVEATRYKATISLHLEHDNAGCVKCFFRRQLINADFPEERALVEEHDNRSSYVGGVMLRKMAGALASNQIAKISLNLRHLVYPGEVQEFNGIDSTLERATLVPDPVCPVCAGGIPKVVPDSYYRSTVEL